jgi:isochorismate pyruvate lyase
MTKCHSITDVRDNIDRIDSTLVALLAERGAYVGEAARLKRRQADVVDAARIADVIAKVRRLAESHGFDADVIEAIYRSMIDHFIAFEEREFDRIKGGG